MGTSYTTVLARSTSLNGVCYSVIFWKSRVAQTAFGIWYFLSFYVVILLIFVFFYWRILVAIRRQASTMAAHGAAGSGTVRSRSKQVQTNVIKTMMIVSGLFAVTWAPLNVYYLLLNVYSTFTAREKRYYAVLFVGNIYLCANPFIYATHFDPVRRVLFRLNPCKETTQLHESIEMT